MFDYTIGKNNTDDWQFPIETQEIFEDLQESYRAEHGERHVPYGTSRYSNVRRDTRPEIPADIKAELEALGMTPEINGVANTDGVDTTSEVA